MIGSLGLLLIPIIARELHVEVATAQWLLTANLLVGAIATPIVGRLSDGVAAKRLLIVVLSLILVGSVVAATAASFPQLLIGRVLQGFSYSVIPVTITLLRRHEDTVRVPGGISALSVTAATGVGIGYPITGIIAASFDFRFAFWFAAIFVATALTVVAVVVPNNNSPATKRGAFDYGGAILLSVGLGSLVLGVSEGPNQGWTSPWTIGLFILTVTALAVWVFVELRSSHPLIRLGVLRHTDVLLANGTALGLGSAMYIGLSVVSLVAQAPRQSGFGLALPLFWAGFVMLPLSLGSQLATRAARSLSRRISNTALLPIGAALVTASNGFMLIGHTQLWDILVGMFLFGLGIGTTFAAMPTLISRSVAVAELGSTVSFNQVLRTIGGSLGSAVAGAILAATTTGGGGVSNTGISTAFGVSAGACLLVFVGLLVHDITSRGRGRSL
ncbi:MFS transporter [Curtobacterium sp. ME26]|uniref:MFS transporter n=1 Tax=Curtobacterium sp. ME26 TaxID=2744254 RepID=UPI0021755E7C|nr:MFS transporter [Curtobacterium sp. ME26]